MRVAPARAIRWFVIAFVGIVVLLSGPAAPAVDFTPSPEVQRGSGSAEASLVSPPSEFRITPGRFGAGGYYLRAPDVPLRVHAVQGRPMVIYRIRVPELDLLLRTRRFLDPGTSGTVVLDPRPRAIDPDSITRTGYRGSVAIRIETFDSDDVIYRSDVTIEVG